MTEVTYNVTIQISEDSDAEDLMDKFEDEISILLEKLDIKSWCIEVE